MKKVEANRYPHSATLFRFCKEALEIRYEGNVKVIDQDVGAILGYDPADCSHWKKGKKNIRALSTLRSIADHLNLDERLLIDIASGKIGLEEAVFEYKGYGEFDMGGKSLETLKKEFFKNPGRWQREGDLRSFEELFDVDRMKVVTVAESVLEKGHFSEAPIYIPELLQPFPHVSCEQQDSLDVPFRIEASGSGSEAKTKIIFKGAEMRPFMRFVVAKELYKYLCRSESPMVSKLIPAPEEVIDIRANIFAGCVLVPGHLLRKEVERIDNSLDIVLQLADTFWVSKSMMNRRLRDYLEHFN